jgi:tellurite resistance protein TerC
MGNPELWIFFNICVVIMLAVDLFVFNRHAHQVSIRESAIWSVVWVALSLAFNYWILLAHGKTLALEFFTGYVVEKSLSMDNVFVFVLIFRAFAIPPKFQHRVLFLGVLGALVDRRGRSLGAAF